MPKTRLEKPDSTTQQRAIARWDGEGGAGPQGPQKGDLEPAATSLAAMVAKKTQKSSPRKLLKDKL